MFLSDCSNLSKFANCSWTHNHTSNQYHFLPQIIEIQVLRRLILPLELRDDILEDHINKVIPHELRIRYQVLQLKLQQLWSCLFLVQQIKVLHLLKHLFFYHLAPDGLDEIIPFCVYLSQLEELLGGEQH